jgi:hypothetical protein
MTTIAWDGHFLASDSLVTTNSGTIISTSGKKIFTPENKEVWNVNNKNIIAIACCGCAGAEIEVIDKMILGIHYNTEYTSVSSFTATCICDDGSVVNIYKSEKESQASIYQLTGCDAHGTGSSYALAAMMMGYSSIEAVNTAIKLDVYSGGVVQVFELVT